MMDTGNIEQHPAKEKAAAMPVKKTEGIFNVLPLPPVTMEFFALTLAERAKGVPRD